MYFNLHTHQSSGKVDVVELVNQYPDEFNPLKYFTIGIHPWRISKQRLDADLNFIESKLLDRNCLALGECGLDKRIETPLEAQIPVFKAQLHLAGKYRKPVVLHCVAAYQETIEIKKELGISVPMIIHGFSKNEQVAKQLLDAGFYLSFGKYLLRNPELETVFKSIPDDRFFLETDMIDETIQEVYSLAAKYKNKTIEQLKQTINKNVSAVFSLNI